MQIGSLLTLSRTLFPRVLLCFHFDWEDISNTQESVSAHFQTPQILPKILCCALYFQLSSQCLELWSNAVFHAWYITSNTWNSLPVCFITFSSTYSIVKNTLLCSDFSNASLMFRNVLKYSCTGCLATWKNSPPDHFVWKFWFMKNLSHL